ncbi:MAG: molybdate ABC transporter substrate-binding protein [Chloroflexota bacterium]
MRLRTCLGLFFAFSMLFAVACGDDDNATTTPAATATAQVTAKPTATIAPPPEQLDLTGQSITVFAASSLTAAFTDIGDAFKQSTGADVTFNFGGSSDLRAQLEQGAAADVFASADTTQLGLAKMSGIVGDDGQIFARNRLVVIIPKANSAGIATLQDLAKSGVKIAMANETVPVGKYGRQFLDKAKADATFGSTYEDNVLGNVVTEATNVKEVASAVQLDEVDAGIVYKTDVTDELTADVTVIDIPDSLNVIATYPITLTTDGSAANEEAAQAFIEFVLVDGQTFLQIHGFLPAGS